MKHFISIILFFWCSIGTESNAQVVIICTGKYATVYHSTKTCKGLNNCKGDIVITLKDVAISVWNRLRPCCICWITNYQACDYDKFYSQGPNYIEPSGPTFKPYVPQNPLANLSLEEYFLYRRIQDYKTQQPIQAISGLLEAITYKSPEDRIREAQQQALQEQERARIQAQRKVILQQKRDNKINEREAKKLVIGSEKYMKCKNSWKQLLGGIILTSTTGFLCLQKGNSISNQYRYATENATSLRKTGNLLYMASPVLFIASGYFTLKFSSKSHKLMTAKKPY